MQPIFNEQIQMWKAFDIDIGINEGMYWLDNGLIKAFTKDGVEHKLYKYKVYDDLHFTITKYKEYVNEDFETWEETISRLNEHINKIEQAGIDVIKRMRKNFFEHNIYVLTSTGKDSMVALHIAQKILPKVQAVFNNTSLDCADSYLMAKSHKNWIITNVEQGFYSWIKDSSFIPTRFSRMCCNIYKEGNHIEYFDDVDKAIWVLGIRKEESANRSKRTDFEMNPKWQKRDWFSCSPIIDWTDFDVWLYILRENIEINPKYKKGYSRVGCAIACPFYTKTTWVLDKYYYPKMYERWHKILSEDFIKNQRWQQLNCTLAEYHNCWSGGLLRTEPTDEVIKELMSYKQIADYNVAKQYFSKVCANDNKPIRQNDVLAMNLKLFGRNTEKFLCKSCICKEMNWSKDDWDAQVDLYKKSECVLF